MDRSGVEDSAEDVDGVSDDEDGDGRRVRRKVNPVVEAPADAGETQQPAAGEEAVPPLPGHMRPLDLPESDLCPSRLGPRELSVSYMS